MANVNINRNLSDQFYRYKMPKLIAKVEGKGNGIKTVIVNMPEIAKSLNRPPMYPTQFFSCSLGAQVNFDNKSERYIVNGSHDPDKLQDLLDDFIQKYVLCQSCENPETILSVNKKKEIIGTNCMACGHAGTIPAADDRVAAYILENPPPSPPTTSRKSVKRMEDETDFVRDTKKAKFEQEDQSQLSSLSGDVDVSDGENYEDIDYGDDDDLNIGDHSKGEHESDDSKSQQARNQLEGDGDSEPDDDLDNYEDDGDTDRGKEATERCKYWPSCNAGDKCNYHHPTKPCRVFPNCRFGKKCLYIHPTCKFSPNCTRPGCPFAHPPNNGSRGLAPKCKFGFSCMNLMCKFSHHQSEPCRFGANCLLESCVYTHPPGTVEKRRKPASAYKWSAQSP